MTLAYSLPKSSKATIGNILNTVQYTDSTAQSNSPIIFPYVNKKHKSDYNIS